MTEASRIQELQTLAAKAEDMWIFAEQLLEQGYHNYDEAVELLADIKRFAANSQDRRYYHPFLIDSKNYMHLPEKTKEWCREMADFLRDSCHLTAQGDYQQAATCFGWLFDTY